MLSLCLILVTTTSNLYTMTNGLDAECVISSLNIHEPCEMNIDQWAAADPMNDVYNCAAGPPHTPAEAADVDNCVAPGCSRIRRNMYTLTDEQLHVVMKALYCAHWESINNELLQTKPYYAQNQWGYISTYHGAPGWFTPCSDFDQAVNYAKGIGPPGCCPHSNPNFVTFHRLLMVQYENSLRQWNLTFALPYWDWVDDPSVYIDANNYGLPELLRNQTWYDRYAGVHVSNPFFNYNSTNGPVNTYIETQKTNNPIDWASTYTCDYVCKAESPELYKRANPEYTGGQTWFDQILQSVLTDNFILFDYNFEVPHNNIHNLIGGNMLDLWYDGVDPIFTFHHSEVERLFLIWQKLMEYRGIDYREKKTWTQYLGCFAGPGGFYLTDDPLAPFKNNGPYGAGNINIDPITSVYGNSSFTAMQYDKLGYEYDSYEIWKYNISQLNDMFDEHLYGDRIYLGWYFNYLNESYTVDFTVYEAGDMDNILATGSFSTLAGIHDSWNNNNFPKHLHRVDITRQLSVNGIDSDQFEDTYLDIEYTITGSKSNTVYSIAQTGVYHPLVIHHNIDGSENIRVYWGESEKYQYNNMTIFINDNIDTTTLSDNTQLEIVYVNESVINITYYYRYDPDVSFYSGFIDAITAVNVSYSISPLLFTEVTSQDTLFSLNYYNFTSSFFALNLADNVALIKNRVYQHGKNVIHSADHSKSIAIYPTVSSFTRMDIYQVLNTNDGTDPRVALNEHIFMPWDRSYIGSSLYNRIYQVNSLASVQFFSCAGVDEEVCQVKTAQQYALCDDSSTAVVQCGVNIFGNLTTATQYYFISNNATQCAKGMKIGVEVPSPNVISGTSCSWCNVTEDLNTSIPVSIAGNTYWINQTIYADSCKTNFSFSMPSDYTWIGYKFYGPSEYVMEGFAAVGVSTWDKGGWFNIEGIGVHPFQSIMECASKTMVGTTYTFKECEVQLCGEALQYWKYSKIEANKQYQMVWKGYNGTLGGFTGIHNHGGSAIFQYNVVTVTEEEETDNCVPFDLYKIFVFIIVVFVFISL